LTASLRTQIQQGGLGIVSQAEFATPEEPVACFDELKNLRSEFNRKQRWCVTLLPVRWPSLPELMVPRRFIVRRRALKKFAISRRLAEWTSAT
jgi:hypothetical protein